MDKLHKIFTHKLCHKVISSVDMLCARLMRSPFGQPVITSIVTINHTQLCLANGKLFNQRPQPSYFTTGVRHSHVLGLST